MAKQTPEAVVDAKKSNFMWTDEETTLLVQVVTDYDNFSGHCDLFWGLK